MTALVTRAARNVAARLGVRVTRAGLPNRFDAMRDTLDLLRRLGYRPRTVIDVGANEGQWHTIAKGVFPTALFHLVEPQPVYWARLDALTPHVVVHRVAATAPGQEVVRMIGAAPDGSTGAFVAGPVETGGDELVARATTLDELIAARVSPADRVLLKIDVEGHELPVLAGAERLLSSVEAIVCETRFYRIDADRRPTFPDLLFFLRERRFELFDVASLSPRPRDGRLRLGDVVFLKNDSPLLGDDGWA